MTTQFHMRLRILPGFLLLAVVGCEAGAGGSGVSEWKATGDSLDARLVTENDYVSLEFRNKNLDPITFNYFWDTQPINGHPDDVSGNAQAGKLSLRGSESRQIPLGVFPGRQSFYWQAWGLGDKLLD